MKPKLKTAYRRELVSFLKDNGDILVKEGVSATEFAKMASKLGLRFNRLRSAMPDATGGDWPKRTRYLDRDLFLAPKQWDAMGNLIREMDPISFRHIAAQCRRAKIPASIKSIKEKAKLSPDRNGRMLNGLIPDSIWEQITEPFLKSVKTTDKAHECQRQGEGVDHKLQAT